VAAELALDVVGVALDLVDEDGIDHGDLDGAGVLGDEEADEELAVEGKLGGDVELAQGHAVVGFVPEGVEGGLDPLVLGVDLQTVAEDEVGAHLDDGVGHGVGVVGFEDLVVEVEVDGGEDVLVRPVVGEPAPVVVLFGAGGVDATPEPIFGDGFGEAALFVVP